eukprot:1136612-Pelagomonas_calceolata.AAC.2
MAKFRPACKTVLQRCTESLSALAAGQLPEELQAQVCGVEGGRTIVSTSTIWGWGRSCKRRFVG